MPKKAGYPGSRITGATFLNTVQNQYEDKMFKEDVDDKIY